MTASLNPTDISFDLIDDVSARNDYFHPVDQIGDVKLSAAIWMTSGIDQVIAKRATLLQYVLRRLSQLHDRKEIWLFVANHADQSDTRIRRYYGLWKALRRRALDFPSRTERFETLHESKDGLKFFGAVKVEPEDSSIMNELMVHESACIALLDRVGSRETVKGLLASGWITEWPIWSPPVRFLKTASISDNIVIEVFGRFDDPEVIVAAYGRTETIRPLRFAGGRGRSAIT